MDQLDETIALDLYRINKRAFDSATDLVPYMWYAYDGGYRVAGPCDSLSGLYTSAREAGVKLTKDACVEQKDNPRSIHVVIG